MKSLWRAPRTPRHVVSPVGCDSLLSRRNRVIPSSLGPISFGSLIFFFPPLSSRPTPSELLSGCSTARVALSARYKATAEWQRAREKPLSLFLRGLTPQSLQAARPATISHDILMKYDCASLLDWIYAYVTVHLLSLPYLCPSLKPILWSWGL